jgi:DNA-binding GntR family transcriptional regulator
MNSEPISDPQRGEVVEFVVQRLREEILEGRFAPGQRLITRELTEDVGVSRGTLREAFRRLAADGLVDLIPNRGAIVHRPSVKDLRDLFRIREALEGMVARMAAESIHEGENRQQLEATWAEAGDESVAVDAATFAQKNRLFHRTIVTLAGNQQLSELIDKMQLPLVMLRLGRSLAPEDIALSMSEHIPIHDAILAGDADAADMAMRKHLRGSCERILVTSAAVLKPERREG